MRASEIMDRRKAIVELLQENNEIRVSQLVNRFNVSDETVRKDLTYLEKEGVLEKKFGKAVRIKGKALEPVLNRTPVNKDKKIKLVQAALELIDENEHLIGLDQGSTVALLANALKNKPTKEFFSGSLAAILELVNSDHTIHCFGGVYSSNDMSFQNDTGKEMYPDIHLDICFFGSSGVANRKGFCTSSLVDAESKRILLRKSTKKIVLLDSTKFETTSLVQVAPWSEVDIVITNQGIPADYQQMIKTSSKLILV